jgi:NADH-quinone oxidoreductase subunit L
MRRMGALKNKIPVTFWTMAIGTLAIAGIPPFAGFFSKDEILWRTFLANKALWVIGAAVAGMTAFYMFRLLFMTFFGESRVGHHTEQHIHESPKVMTVPLMVLALGSVVAGWIGLPKWLPWIGLPAWMGTSYFEHWLDPVFEFKHHAAEAAEAAAEHGPGLEFGMAMVSVLIAAAGIYLAYSTYYKKSDRAERVSTGFAGAYRTLLNKWYVDELYDGLFVNRAKDFGRYLWRVDARIVDGVINGSAGGTKMTASGSSWWDRWIVDGLVRMIGGVIKTLSWPVGWIQTGYTQNYALFMTLGVLALIGYVFWGDTLIGYFIRK